MSRETPGLGFLPRTVIACAAAMSFASLGGAMVLWLLSDSLRFFVNAFESLAGVLGIDSSIGEAIGIAFLLTAPQSLCSIAAFYMADRLMRRAMRNIRIGPGKRVVLVAIVVGSVVIAAAALLVLTEDAIRALVKFVESAIDTVIRRSGVLDELAAWTIVITAPATLIATVACAYVEHRWRRAFESIPMDDLDVI